MRKLPITAAILLCALISPAFCDPQPGEERTWTGVNGKNFLGVFARTYEDGAKKAEFITTSGKVVSVALDNLIEEDRRLILVFEGKAPAEPAVPAVDQSEFFKKLPIAARNKIPPLESEEIATVEYESIVDAVWVSLLWWDAEGIMPVPKSGDFDRKADWLYKELTRGIKERGTETATLEQTKEGLAEYFERRLEETGTFKAKFLFNVDVENLSRSTTGNTIVVLKMTMTYSDSKAYSTAAALESMAPDGTFVMHMFGRRLTGKMTAAPAKKGGGNGAKAFDLIVSNPEVIPDYYKQNGAKFSIGDRHWNGALLVDPYVYKTPGMKAPVPE